MGGRILDFITVGSATRDVFLFSKEFLVTPLPELQGKLGECVALGAKIDIERAAFTTGGGATNAATTFAKLGFLTGVLSRVGQDEAGASIVEELKNLKIDTTRVRKIKDAQTAYSTLLTAQNGERTALVFRGACSTFTDADIAWHRLQAKWFYLTSLGGNTGLVQKIVKHAERIKAKVAYNPSRAELKKPEALKPILKLLSIISLNVEEAQELTGLTTRDPHKLVRAIAVPDLIVVLTDGVNGAYAFCNDDLYFVRTTGVASVSRTGAGDAFSSAFTAAIAKNHSLEDALRVGLLNAESVVQKIGAKAGILRAWPSRKALAAIRVRKV